MRENTDRMMNKEIQTYDEKLQRAVAVIKETILQGQYEACKGINRIQLAVYFGIGKYISQHTRKGVWGTGALDAISNQLRRELPGLRGYSAANLKNMRLFYEAWQMLDNKSSVATDEKSASAIAEIKEAESQVISSRQISSTMQTKSNIVNGVDEIDTEKAKQRLANSGPRKIFQKTEICYSTAEIQSENRNHRLRNHQFVLSWSHYLVLMRIAEFKETNGETE